MQSDDTAKQRKREAQRVAGKRWRDRNKDNPEVQARLRAAYKRYREAHTDKVKAKEAAYREANREKLRARDRQIKRTDRASDREAYNAYMREYRAANREKMAAIDLKRRSGEKSEPFNARRRRHSEKNRAKILEANRRHYEATKDLGKYLANNRNRRALQAGLPGKHTANDILGIWIRQRKQCAVPNCDHPIAESGRNKYHVDHIIPVVAPGSSNDPSNLQILCQFHNSRKHATDDVIWAQSVCGTLFVL